MNIARLELTIAIQQLTKSGRAPPSRARARKRVGVILKSQMTKQSNTHIHARTPHTHTHTHTHSLSLSLSRWSSPVPLSPKKMHLQAPVSASPKSATRAFRQPFILVRLARGLSAPWDAGGLSGTQWLEGRVALAAAVASVGGFSGLWCAYIRTASIPQLRLQCIFPRLWRRPSASVVGLMASQAKPMQLKQRPAAKHHRDRYVGSKPIATLQTMLILNIICSPMFHERLLFPTSPNDHPAQLMVKKSHSTIPLAS